MKPLVNTAQGAGRRACAVSPRRRAEPLRGGRAARDARPQPAGAAGGPFDGHDRSVGRTV